MPRSEFRFDFNQDLDAGEAYLTKLVDRCKVLYNWEGGIVWNSSTNTATVTLNGKIVDIVAGGLFGARIVNGHMVVNQDSFVQYFTSNFEAVLATFHESYRAGLRAIHEAHPNWRFESYNTGIEFSSFIDKEMNDGQVCTPEAKYGYDPAWRDPKFTYDPGYYAASREAVSYFMDPRNFLNDTQVFQFLSAKYDFATQNIDAVNNVLNGTALMNYANTFLEAGGQEVSAAFLAAKSRIETNGGTSALATGTVPGYEGYYNFYGLGAYDGNAGAAGANFAKVRGWNTPELGITCGAEYIDVNWVDKGQDTLYTMKWNIEGFKSSGGISGQYATHIKDAYNKAYSFAQGLKTVDAPISFRIPVYNGMPATPSPEPTQAVARTT